MSEHSRGRRQWRANLLLAVGALLTVLVGLLMAQLDQLQKRLPVASTNVVAADAVATVVLPTNIAAVAVSLPTTTLPATTSAAGLAPTAGAEASPTAPPSETPVSPTPTDLPGETPVSPTPTALPNCVPAPPSGWTSYTVQPGDTLSDLAQATGTTAGFLAEVNCLEGQRFDSGTSIYLPSAPAPPVASEPEEPAACVVPAGWVPYVVQPGNTMFSLARSRGTHHDVVRRANCKSSYAMTAGETIYLPPLPAGGVDPTSVPPPTSAPAPTSEPASNSSPPPTDTPQPAPSDTPAPPPTASPPPLPSPTPEPPATNTPLPEPDDTPSPEPGNTPEATTFRLPPAG